VTPAWKHYERAFDRFLRERRVPHVRIDQARELLVPSRTPRHDAADPAGLKYFDFVVYGDGVNLLVELKGRRVVLRADEAPPRLECWAMADDVASLREWETLFGHGFEAVFVFAYWSTERPAPSLFDDVFEHDGRWYGLRAVRVADYAASMRTRSPRWGTVDLAQPDFARISAPFRPGSPIDQRPVPQAVPGHEEVSG